MFYVDSLTSVSPVILNTRSTNIINVFRDLLIKLIGEQKSILYEAINGDIITINNGLINNDDFSIYELSDGIKTIFTKLQKIDGNNFKVIEDISGFNKNNITLKTPKLNADFEETATDYIFYFKRELKIRIPKNTTYIFYVSNNSIEQAINVTPALNARTSSGGGWFCFYNDFGFLFSCQNNYAAPLFNSIYYANTTEDGYIEAICNPGNGANTQASAIVFDSSKIHNFTDYAPTNISSEFFGVSRLLDNSGYIFSDLLKTGGSLPIAERSWPVLINKNIVVFQMLRDAYVGIFYDR